jgi:HSP20 family molecular chaperone IbpA
MFFDFEFDRPFYRFSREFLKDMNPYEIIRKDNSSIIVHNIVGIPKEDIHIDLKKENKVDYLVISGETKNEVTNRTYSISSRFRVDSDEIKDIDWEVKDGLLYVEVHFKESQKPDIKISYKG